MCATGRGRRQGADRGRDCAAEGKLGVANERQPVWTGCLHRERSRQAAARLAADEIGLEFYPRGIFTLVAKCCRPPLSPNCREAEMALRIFGSSACSHSLASARRRRAMKTLGFDGVAAQETAHDPFPAARAGSRAHDTPSADDGHCRSFRAIADDARAPCTRSELALERPFHTGPWFAGESTHRAPLQYAVVASGRQDARDAASHPRHLRDLVSRAEARIRRPVLSAHPHLSRVHSQRHGGGQARDFLWPRLGLK